MLLSDTYHLIGFNIFDRRKVDEERKIEKNKKLGLRSYITSKEDQGSDAKTKSPYGEIISPMKKQSPLKGRELASPEKIKLKN